MKRISTIGLDIAKRFFQVHGIDDHTGEIVVRKQLRRSEMLHWFSGIEPCLVGLEACATAHYWGRELAKLGHRVKLLPPAYVKPYVRRQKNDRVDAEAICEALTRPTMRFVSIKTEEQQAVQSLHRTRELLIRQRTQAINALRAHLAEFGHVFPQGNAGAAQAMAAARDESGIEIPAVAREVLQSIADQIENLKNAVRKLERQMLQWHRTNADSQRLATVPGIGVVTATATIASVGDGKQFRSGREFAAWIGLVPRQNSSGGKERLGRISKKGNTYLRKLLVLDATGFLIPKQRRKAPGGVWFENLVQRKAARLATVAMANKMARVAWAVLTKGNPYRCGPIAVGVNA